MAHVSKINMGGIDYDIRDKVLTSELSAEQEARTNRDNELNAAITAETQAREAVDSALQSQVEEGLGARYTKNEIDRMLQAGYLFAGTATPTTNPGTPDAKVFYIANGKGTYEKFGGIEVTEDDVVFLYWDSSWHKVSTGIASQKKLNQFILSENATDNELNSRIVAVRDVVGGETSLRFNSLDYSGMVFNGSAIVSAETKTNSFLVRVYAGIEYSISPSPLSIRFSRDKFTIGGDTGAFIKLPGVIANDGWLLITINKSSGEFTLGKQISGLSKIIQDNREQMAKTTTSVSGEYPVKAIASFGNRLSKGIPLPFRGKAKVTMEVTSGTDTGTYTIYRYVNGEIGAPLASFIAFGQSAEITIPDGDDGVWLFTNVKEISEERTYLTKFYDIDWAIKTQLNNVEREVESIVNVVGLTWYPETLSRTSGRLNKLIYIGHPGESAIITLRVTSGTDQSKWRIYKTNEAVTSLDVDNPLSDFEDFGKYASFIVPSNGYIALFTQDNSLSGNRTYSVDVSGTESILKRLDGLMPLFGKTIVCFGDSITEFSYNGMRYSDWLAQMSGANVINVGVGGTQLRQRTTPSATPVSQNQCYAGLDIVNMVKAAMTGDYTIVEASAQKLSEISADDNRATIARLKNIDWGKVDIVTFLGGTNDWYGNMGNTGDKDSTNVNETCGAINDIIARIGSTYPKVQIYWFTPIVRFVNAPEFSAATQYQVGDLCTYSGGNYRFINAHLGAWDSNDVESVQKSAFRVPQYYSDNYVINGKTLREFSELLLEVVKNQHIPIDDLYNNLGWNLHNFGQYFLSSDNTHPYNGFEMMAEKFFKFITSHW